MTTERTLSDLALDLAQNAGDLIRNEARLARAEAVENIRGMGGGLARIAMGVAVAGAAVTLALGAVALALSNIMPLWGAAIISALIGAVVAYIAIKSGLKALSPDQLTLDRTTRHVQRDLSLIKEKVSS